MIYFIILIGIVLAAFSWLKPKWAFYLMLALISFHAFLLTSVSHFLHFDVFEQNLFAAWKELILFVLLVRYFWTIAKVKNFKPNILLVDKLVFTLFIIAIISSFVFTRDFKTAFLGLRYDFEMFLIYFLARGLDWGGLEIRKIVAIVLSSGLIVAVFAILQYLVLPSGFLTYFGYSQNTVWFPGSALPSFQAIGGSGIARSQSFLAGPNQLASYLLILISFAIVFIYQAKNLKPKIIFGLYLLIFLSALIFTFSRSGLVGFLAILITFLLIILKRKQIIYLFIGAVLISLVFWLVLKNLSSQFINIFIEHQGSTLERFGRIQDGIKEIIRNPLGIGIGKAGLVSYQIDKAKSILPENWYLQIALEMGILGLLIYLAIIWEFLKNLWLGIKNYKHNFQKQLVMAVFLSIIGLSVYSLFLHTWSDISTTLTFWALLGIIYSRRVFQ